MKLTEQIIGGFSRWIDCVAETLFAVRRRFAKTRTIHLAEGTDHSFTVLPAREAPQQGEYAPIRIVDGELVGSVPELFQTQARASRIEVVLQPSRFVFRPLELPRRAGEFLDGIVRAQVDRLTPWSAEDAAFGWSRPTEATNDRIVVIVAAAARSAVAPFANALAGLAPDSIAVSTLAPNAQGDALAIKVFEQKGRAAREIHRLRRILAGALLLAAFAAVVAFATDSIIGANVQARQDDVAHRIATDQASLQARIAGGRDSVLAALEHRKQQTASSVIVLEALSRLFPDDTYVTELRIVGDKMQVVGITRDAPSLIQLIAQSPYFAQARFFAPTTRSPAQAGENFHIETQILPVFAPPS